MKTRLTISSLIALIGIVLGAFGAHALKEILTPESLNSFDTAIRYLMFHALALLMINLSDKIQNKTQIIVSSFFYLGILFFSGSIIMISTKFIEAKYIWFITPLGGLLFIVGWAILAFSFSKNTKSKK